MIKTRKITPNIRLLNSFSRGRYVSEPDGLTPYTFIMVREGAVGDDAFLHSVEEVNVISFWRIVFIKL
jgi:hypothetical protein